MAAQSGEEEEIKEGRDRKRKEERNREKMKEAKSHNLEQQPSAGNMKCIFTSGWCNAGSMAGMICCQRRSDSFVRAEQQPVPLPFSAGSRL